MHILLKKLTTLHDLSAEERFAVVAALGPPRVVARHDDIVPDDSSRTHTTVMLSGIACRYKLLSDRRRHILTFQYPGDMIDLYSYVVKTMDHAVGALSDCQVAEIPHEKIKELSEQFPNLQYAFWRDTMVDLSISHMWALGGGRKTLERVAHMLCEIFVRLEAVGLADLARPLPFMATQKDLAAALGLSLVHTNKTLAILKTRKIIARLGTRLQILDWGKLTKTANFDPGYLHFR